MAIDKKTKLNLFKQRIQSVHVSAGITFSLFMYICLFFGIFAILLPYIKVWEKPSRHFAPIEITKINYSAMIDPVISAPDFPKNNIIVRLPGFMNEPALSISHQFTKAIFFNPSSMERIDDEGKQSRLALFLNHMHYGRPLGFLGKVFFGLISVGVLFLIIGGLIQVYLIKYGNKGKTKQRFFSKWHRKIFTWVFAPFILITLTGALMNVGLIGASPMAGILTNGKTTDIQAVVGPTLFPQPKAVPSLKEKAKMLPISQLIKKAQSIDSDINFQELRLINWNDKSAQIELKGYNPYMPFLNGIFNKPSIILSAVDASLIKHVDVMDRTWSMYVAESTFFLHFLFGVDIFTRLFITLLMLASTFAVGFAVSLYLEKKAKKFDGKIPFYHWMGKLSLAVIIGVIPATGLIFNLQWLLPFDMQDRVFWQQAIFFNFWLATLTWSFYRIESFKAAKEFLILGAVLFMFAPIVHFINSGFTPISLFVGQMKGILNVDISLFIFGLILLFVGLKLPKTREESKLIWNKKEERINSEK